MHEEPSVDARLVGPRLDQRGKQPVANVVEDRLDGLVSAIGRLNEKVIEIQALVTGNHANYQDEALPRETAKPGVDTVFSRYLIRLDDGHHTVEEIKRRLDDIGAALGVPGDA